MKASRDCTYAEQSIFRSQDIRSTPRRKRANSASWQEEQHPTMFGENHTWVEVPSKRKCHNLSAFYSAHNRSVTFVQVEDPWAPDDDTIVDAQEYNTDRGTDTRVENADSGYHIMSDYGSVQSPSFQRAAALDAPQENTPPFTLPKT